MRARKNAGVIGLMITFTLNLVALFIFRLISAVFFSPYWWACWAPSYIVWLTFSIVWRTKRGQQKAKIG